MILPRSFYIEQSWAVYLGRLLFRMLTFFRLNKSKEVIINGASSGYPNFKKHNGKVQCTSCGICESHCPTDAINLSLSNKIDLSSDPFNGPLPKKFEIDLSKCIQCSECARICPVDALAMLGGTTKDNISSLI